MSFDFSGKRVAVLGAGKMGGILPKASPKEARTLDEAGPNVIVTSGKREPSPRSPALSKQAGHRPEGASVGRFAPQPRQQSRSFIANPPRSGPRSHYSFHDG